MILNKKNNQKKILNKKNNRMKKNTMYQNDN